MRRMFPATVPPVAPMSVMKVDEPEKRAPKRASEGAANGVKKAPPTRARGVSLAMLIKEKILEPGLEVLSIDYLGERYVADLLDTGKIQWNGIPFASPSSWAIYVKKQIDPKKKSGCGWNSVKYQGKKLDFYKSLYNKKMKAAQTATAPVPQPNEITAPTSFLPPYPIRHSKLKEIAGEIHPNALIECEDFDQNSGKSQPFFVTVSTNCLLLINFHCHLTHGEVVGYLGGKWDQEKQCLIILQAFPCKCVLGDRQTALVTEEQIRQELHRRSLFKVGWYHSHPTSPAEPTLRDIEHQLQYQMKFSANNPMLGLICSPSQDTAGTVTEPKINAFWVAPTMEQAVAPNSCLGVPMRFAFSELQDQSLDAELNQELSWLVDYYAMSPDLINFSRPWRGNANYLERLRYAVMAKLPKDRNTVVLMQIIQKLGTTCQ